MRVMRKANEFKTILDGGDYQWLEGDNVREVLESAGITRDDIGNNSEWWEVDHLFVKDYEGERCEIWGYNAHGGMVPEKATFWLLWKDGRLFETRIEAIDDIESATARYYEDLEYLSKELFNKTYNELTIREYEDVYHEYSKK